MLILTAGGLQIRPNVGGNEQVLDYFIERDNPEVDEVAKNAFADKVDKLKRIIEQDGNFDGGAEDSKAKASRLFKTADRRRQYQTWLASGTLGEQDGATHSYILQTLQRLDEFQSGKRGGETHLADDQRGVQGESHQNADGETRVQQGASRGRSGQPVLKYDPKVKNSLPFASLRTLRPLWMVRVINH